MGRIIETGDENAKIGVGGRVYTVSLSDINIYQVDDIDTSFNTGYVVFSDIVSLAVWRADSSRFKDSERFEKDYALWVPPIRIGEEADVGKHTTNPPRPNETLVDFN
jgi:hypothetical protein